MAEGSSCRVYSSTLSSFRGFETAAKAPNTGLLCGGQVCQSEHYSNGIQVVGQSGPDVALVLREQSKIEIFPGTLRRQGGCYRLETEQR